MHKLALSGTYILLSSLRNPMPSFDQRPSGWSKWLDMEVSRGSVARISEWSWFDPISWLCKVSEWSEWLLGEMLRFVRE